MINVDEVLKNKDELQKILEKIPTLDLADALASRNEVKTLRQRGVYAILIQQPNSQTA